MELSLYMPSRGHSTTVNFELLGSWEGPQLVLEDGEHGHVLCANGSANGYLING